jgi:hypothetical protein
LSGQMGSACPLCNQHFIILFNDSTCNLSHFF